MKRLTTQQSRKYKQPQPTTRCLVQFAQSPQGTAHIRSISGGSSALDTFLSTEPQPLLALPRSATYNARVTPIKRSSLAQAPTRIKIRADCPASPPPRGTPPKRPPQSSPSRPTKRAHSELQHIVLEEGDPERDSLPRPGPYASLVPASSPLSYTCPDRTAYPQRIRCPPPVPFVRDYYYFILFFYFFYELSIYDYIN